MFAPQQPLPLGEAGRQTPLPYALAHLVRQGRALRELTRLFDPVYAQQAVVLPLLGRAAPVLFALPQALKEQVAPSLPDLTKVQALGPRNYRAAPPLVLAGPGPQLPVRVELRAKRLQA